MCKQVTLKLHNHPITIDLYALPLSEADVVLYVQWLKQLGPVIMDYNALNMWFMWEGKLIHLVADSVLPLEISLS